MKLKNLFLNLTKFELSLWICSVTVTTVSFFIVPDKDYLTLIASLIGVTALIFVAKGYVIGQILTVIFAVFYGIISFYFKYYGEMLTYLCMTSPIAVMSVVAWLRHPYKNTEEVKVNNMSKIQTGVMITLAVAATVTFYFILNAIGTANIIFSTVSVTTSFIASYLTLMRSPYYGIGYAANDIILIILWIMATLENISYFPMIICFLMFLLNDVYGFFNWQRIRKIQSSLKE